MGIDEIAKTINKYEGSQRAELVDFYIEVVNNALEDGRQINAKRIELILDACKFTTSDERKLLINKAINIKVLQIRLFILENNKEDYSIERSRFSSISKWMRIVIKEIQSTFNLPLINKKLAQEFHKKLGEEFILLFCSDERYNSAGNQLLLDITAYFEAFKDIIEDTDSFITKIENNFLPGKVFTKEKIYEIYCKIPK